MKRVILGFLLGIAVILGMAAQRAMVGSELATPNFPWVAAASFLSAGTEATALDVTERTYKTITTAIAAAASGDGDEEIVIYTPPYGTNAIRIRAIGLSPNGTVEIDILSGTFDGSTDDCEMALRGTLTFTIGLQKSAVTDYEIADICTLTATSDAATTSDWIIANPATGSETVAEALLDLQGDDKVVLVPIEGSLTSNSKILIKPY